MPQPGCRISDSKKLFVDRSTVKYITAGLTVSTKYKQTISKKLFFVGVLRVTDKKQEPEPDPLVRGTDPRIGIRTKMSRIRNTDYMQLTSHLS
jgi:hypothetical protein